MSGENVQLVRSFYDAWARDELPGPVRGRGSGVELDGRESALWTLREGKVTRYAWFHGPADALEAVERREGEL